MKAISSSRPTDAVTASLNGADCSAAASANATSAKASGALVCPHDRAQERMALAEGAADDMKR